LDQVQGPDVTPEAAAITTEAMDELQTALSPEEGLIAVYKLNGRSNTEIASILECGLSTIERRLRLIRRKWSESAN